VPSVRSSNDHPDDLRLLAERLRLGLPLQGFDSCDIPLRYRSGIALGPVEAALLLLLSATRLMRADADMVTSEALAHAEATEAAAHRAGDPPRMVAEKTSRVLVRAAVRASLLARGRDARPDTVDQATLSWYQVSDLRRRELLDCTRPGPSRQRSA
jgi:hypothetical protein